MKRDIRRRERRLGQLADSGRETTRRLQASTPVLEPLEERQLLSLYQGPTMNRAVWSGNAFYQVSVTGGGYEKLTQIGSGHHKLIGISLYGTTSASQLNISLKSAQRAFGTSNTALQIGRIFVQSGQLGAINAVGAASLVGNVTPLNGSVQTIGFNDLGPNAQINVLGTLGSFQVGSAKLSSNGLINITGGVSGKFDAGSLVLNGGKVFLGSVGGGLSLSGLSINTTGQFNVAGDVSGDSNLGAVDISGGRFVVGHNLNGNLTTGELRVSNAGQIIVTNDITGAVQVNGSAKVSSNGVIQVGRDVLGAADITADLSLDSGGKINVGRNATKLTVNGNVVFTPSAGTVSVQGNLNGFTVNGFYEGRSNTSFANPELIVGLNLTNPTVLGGTTTQGGISDANIAVGKNIIGFDVPHGVFNSLITAGVLIDGAAQSSTPGGNIGPDGVDAIFDSQILAGQEINNFTINGNVHSDWVTNPTPTGLPTRIVAGENGQGDFTSGGLIDNFQITGALIDSVLAASVQPYGGDGTLPPTGYAGNRAPAPQPAPGAPDYYNAPAGVITGGTFAAPIDYANFGYVSYFNEIRNPTTAFNRAIDPNVHVNILQGAINPSFASTPLPSSVTSTVTSASSSTLNQTTSTSGAAISSTVTSTTDQIAIPTKSTVLGGVISTTQRNNDNSDFAGIYAADTSGVFVGVIPTQSK